MSRSGSGDTTFMEETGITYDRLSKKWQVIEPFETSGTSVISGSEVKTHPGRLLSAKESNQTSASSQTNSLFSAQDSCSTFTGRKDEEAESSWHSAIEVEVLAESGIGEGDADLVDTSFSSWL